MTWDLRAPKIFGLLLGPKWLLMLVFLLLLDRALSTQTFIAAAVNPAPQKATDTATAKFYTPEPALNGDSGSASGPTKVPGAFQWNTPGVTTKTLTRNLFMAPTSANQPATTVATTTGGHTSSAKEFGSMAQTSASPNEEASAQALSKHAPQQAPKAHLSGSLAENAPTTANRVSHNQTIQGEGVTGGRSTSSKDECPNQHAQRQTPNEPLFKKEVQSSLAETTQQPSVQPFSLEQISSDPQPASSITGTSNTQLRRQIQFLSRSLEAVSQSRSKDSEPEVVGENNQLGMYQRGTEYAFKQSAKNDIKNQEDQDQAAEGAAANGEVQTTNMMMLLEEIFRAQPELRQQLLHKASSTQIQPGESVDSQMDLRPCHNDINVAISSSNKCQPSKVELSTPAQPAPMKNQDTSDACSSTLRPVPQLSSSTQGDHVISGAFVPRAPAAGLRKQTSGVGAPSSGFRGVPVVNKLNNRSSVFAMSTADSKVIASNELQSNQAVQPIQSDVQRNSKIAGLSAFSQKPDRICQFVEPRQSVFLTPHAQPSTESNQSSALVSHLQPRPAQGAAAATCQSVWRGSLDHIQSWRRQATSVSNTDDLKTQQTSLSGGNLKQASGLLQHSASLSSLTTTAITSALVDKQKMIEMCDKEVALIQKEFALLERQDFVDLLQSQETLPLSQEKAVDEEKPKTDSTQLMQNVLEQEKEKIAVTCQATSEPTKIALDNQGGAAQASKVMAEQVLPHQEQQPKQPLSNQKPINTLYTQFSGSSNRSMPPPQTGTIVQGALPKNTDEAQRESPQSQQVNLLTKNQAVKLAVEASEAMEVEEREDDQPVKSSDLNTKQPESKLNDEQLDTRHVEERKSTPTQSPQSKKLLDLDHEPSKRSKHDSSHQQQQALMESDSQNSDDVSLARRDLQRQQLTESTEAVLVHVIALLRNDHPSSTSISQPQQTPVDPSSTTIPIKETSATPYTSTSLLSVPVFDKSVNYLAKVQEQSKVLETVQNHHESHADDYLCLFKDVMRSQKRLRSKIAENEERLLIRKRDEKLSRKELQKMLSLHSTAPVIAGPITAAPQPHSLTNLGDVMSSLAPKAAIVSSAFAEAGAQQPTIETVADSHQACNVTKNVPSCPVQQSGCHSVEQIKDVQGNDLVVAALSTAISSIIPLHGKFPTTATAAPQNTTSLTEQQLSQIMFSQATQSQQQQHLTLMTAYMQQQASNLQHQPSEASDSASNMMSAFSGNQVGCGAQSSLVDPQIGLNTSLRLANSSPDLMMLAEVTNQRQQAQHQSMSVLAANASIATKQTTSVSQQQNLSSSGLPQQDPQQDSQQLQMAGNNSARLRKHRRMANQIKKEYKCFYCEKFYGSSAAAIMHMRKKHKEGTKQEIERRRGIRVNEILKSQVTLPMSQYSQQDLERNAALAAAGQPNPALANQTAIVAEMQLQQPLQRPQQQQLGGQGEPVTSQISALAPIVNPQELQARLLASQQAQNLLRFSDNQQ